MAKPKNFYIHFETKPTFAELDVFFERCVQFYPVMSNSYFVKAETTSPADFTSFAKQCFPRRHFFICASSHSRYSKETGYTSSGIIED